MRMLLKTGLIALGVVCVSGWGHATMAAERPNVVLMLADNLGFGDIGAYGGGEILGTPSPNLDSLAADGLMLTQFFVEPGCTPSRAGLMTGRYSVRSGLNSIIVAGTPQTSLTCAWIRGTACRQSSPKCQRHRNQSLDSSADSAPPDQDATYPSCPWRTHFF